MIIYIEKMSAEYGQNRVSVSFKNSINIIFNHAQNSSSTKKKNGPKMIHSKPSSASKSKPASKTATPAKSSIGLIIFLRGWGSRWPNKFFSLSQSYQELFTESKILLHELSHFQNRKKAYNYISLNIKIFEI